MSSEQTSVTRLGNFWKSFWHKFFHISRQNVEWHFYVKQLGRSFGQLLEKIGLLFIPTSDHTGADATRWNTRSLKSTFTQGSPQLSGFVLNFYPVSPGSNPKQTVNSFNYVMDTSVYEQGIKINSKLKINKIGPRAVWPDWANFESFGNKFSYKSCSHILKLFGAFKKNVTCYEKSVLITFRQLGNTYFILLFCMEISIILVVWGTGIQTDSITIVQ